MIQQIYPKLQLYGVTEVFEIVEPLWIEQTAHGGGQGEVAAVVILAIQVCLWMAFSLFCPPKNYNFKTNEYIFIMNTYIMNTDFYPAVSKGSIAELAPSDSVGLL